MEQTNARSVRLLAGRSHARYMSLAFSFLVALAFQLDVTEHNIILFPIRLLVGVSYFSLCMAGSCCWQEGSGGRHLLALIHSGGAVLINMLVMFFAHPGILGVVMVLLATSAHLLLALEVCPRNWETAKKLGGAPILSVIAQMSLAAITLGAAVGGFQTYGTFVLIGYGKFVLIASLISAPIRFGAEYILSVLECTGQEQVSLRSENTDGSRAVSALGITISALLCVTCWFALHDQNRPSGYEYTMIIPALCLLVRHVLLERAIRTSSEIIGNSTTQELSQRTLSNRLPGPIRSSVPSVRDITSSVREIRTGASTYTGKHTLVLGSACVSAVGCVMAVPGFSGIAQIALILAVVSAFAVGACSVSSLLIERKSRYARFAPVNDINFRLVTLFKAMNVILKLISIYVITSATDVTRRALPACADRMPNSYEHNGSCSGGEHDKQMLPSYGAWDDYCPGCFHISSWDAGACIWRC